MIKILDLDKLFDKYISEYVYKNIGKIKAEEIENQMPVMYEKFGNEKLDILDGFSPNDYYKQFSPTELCECLKEHIEKNVPISDFLCEALTKDNSAEDSLISLLSNTENEELIIYILNMLLELNTLKAKGELLNFIISDYPEAIREISTEILLNNANAVKQDILEVFNDTEGEVRECLTEILSRCDRDDRVFDILVSEFNANQDKIAIYAENLTKYGDERALSALMTAIENEKINYADFTELRFAIEALGGEYNKERDFSHDKYYQKIKNAKRSKIM